MFIYTIIYKYYYHLYCKNCGSDKTYLRNGKYEFWCKGLCKKCHNKLIDNPKVIVDYSLKRIKFKDKRPYLKERMLTGVCNWCRAVVGIDCKRTSMHHLQYDNTDPLKYTIELCNRCHTLEHVNIIKIK